MKKLYSIIAVLALCALPALAAMDSVTFSGNVAGLTTNTLATYVMRGHIESVNVAVSSAATGTVTVTDSYGTIFTKSCTGTNHYFPRAAAHTTAGAAMTWTELGKDAAGDTTNVVTTTQFYEKIAVAGPVVVTVNQTATGGTASQNTNAYAVTVIYDK